MRHKQFVLFLVAGGLAALINFSSRILLSRAMPYVWAIVVAYLIGMTAAFILNRLFVFTDTINSAKKQALWFTAVNLIAIVQTLAISLLLARTLLPAIGFTTYTDTIAHAVGVAVPVITSFIGHKYLSFRQTAPRNNPPVY